MMKNISIWKHSFLLSVALILSGASFAQKKYVETFSVGDDVLVSVNTSHTHVVFETWNKDVVEVEARIEGENLSAAQKKEIFDNWDFDILGNSKKVVITSHAAGWNGMESLSGLGALKSLESLKVLEQLPEMPILKDLTTMNFDVVVPDVPDYEEMPNWPFTKERASIHYKDGYTNFNFNNNGSYVFDKSEYERDKQSYVDKLNRKYKTNVTVKQTDRWLSEVDEWAEGFEKVMEAWGEDFGEKFSNQFGPEFEKKMEAWGENLGKQMEAWGEEFGKEFEKEMEAWGENFGREMEAWAQQFEDGPHRKDHKVKTFILHDKDGGSSKYPNARKTIIIKMPKGGKTDINVRHGEVKMADAYNVRAKLNYAALTANSIDGGSTLINAAYAPVYINKWNNGSLDVDYVEDCKLNEVENIVLEANSSNVQINMLDREALLQGSFGNLFINKVAKDFKVVDIVLDNTNATIMLPDVGFEFYFNGRKTRLLHPKSLKVDQTNTGNRVLLRGYHKAQNNTASFKIDARYSDVKLQRQ